jgi:hypothetical protein
MMACKSHCKRLEHYKFKATDDGTHVIVARVYKEVIIDPSVIKLGTSIHNHCKRYPEESKHIPVPKQILKLKVNHSKPNVV